ncbi:MAG TPA: hypothetical protein VLH08_05725, partial [Acidobacteriota bacterium]|nr:hypothetical protein [Acidobacteriota bacterium]
MKVLIKDKIVESFKFPLTEALSFSILVWTIWGLVEAFYWQKLSPMFDKDSARLSPYIFIASFFLYLLIAAIVAVLTYALVKWVLFTMGSDDDQTFRSATLAGILGIFFLAVLYHAARLYIGDVEISRGTRWVMIGSTIVLILLITSIFYRITSRIGFRLRRSGTLMFSVLAISIVLSFVHFPMYTSDAENQKTYDLRT